MRWAMRRTLRSVAMAAASIAVAVASIKNGAAQTMAPPTIEQSPIDWNATGSDFSAYRGIIDDARLHGRISLATLAKIALVKLRFKTLRSADLQATVNELMGERFRRIANSSTPVLLPVDTAKYLADRLSPDGAGPTAAYLNGFNGYKYFGSGPSGFDAIFTMPAEEVASALGDKVAPEVTVSLSGSSLVYVLKDPPPPTGDLDGRFANLSNDVRRVVHERALRFTFSRYGAAYLVSIDCRPQGRSAEFLSCPEADRIAERFLKSLHLAGGAPSATPAPFNAPVSLDRPKCPDPQFAFHSPGDLLEGTGYNGASGRADHTVYSRILFPIAATSAFANSQVFMNGGECLTDPPANITTVPEPKVKGDPYVCKQNPKLPLTFFEGAQGNYNYPWRDNFCESRDWPLGQCPGGQGHQGQDIRPDTCFPVSPTSVRCEPYRHRVNAVKDGVVLRERGKEALYLVVNTPTEHIRFRYLHMKPEMMDHDGMLTGRELKAGERIGLMGNFLDGKEGGTFYHLHFDVQVPTRDGWLYVNPFMTLVSAYERRLGRYGAEIMPDGTRVAPEPAQSCR